MPPQQAPASTKVQRGVAKSKITRVNTYVAEHPLNTGVSIQQYETRLELLETAFKEFDLCHNQLSEEEQQTDLQYYVEVEELFLDVKCKLKEFIASIHEREQQVDITMTRNMLRESLAVANNQQQANQHLMHDVKLPTLTITPFNGCYNDWPAFHDSFDTIVNKNTALSSGNKLQYLKSLLTGEPLKLVTHFTITDANFPVAWELLISRFNKKKHIVQALVIKFIEQPSTPSTSAVRLRELTSTSTELIRALDALDCNSRDPWIIYLLLEKMDSETKSLWSYETAGNEVPKLEAFLTFLEKRCDALESINIGRQSIIRQPSHNIRSHSSNMNKPMVKTQKSTTQVKCLSCNDHHYLFQCPRFKQLDLSARLDFVHKNDFCTNCLFRFHNNKYCKSNMLCRHCQQRHHTLLHKFPATTNLVQLQDPSSAGPSTSTSTEISNPLIAMYGSATHHQLGILPTAVVNIEDTSGHHHHIRALLDSGSEASFITESFVQQLRLTRSHGRMEVRGFSSVHAGITRGVTTVTISSRYNTTTTIRLNAFILSRLTSKIPSQPFDLNNWNELSNIPLADPRYGTPAEIDLIIGSSRFMSLLQPGLLTSSNNLAVAKNSAFGWIISGELESQRPEILTCHADVDELLTMFWKIEDVQSAPSLTQEEQDCESHFVATHQRSSTGRYIVRLPFKHQHFSIGNSIHAARLRLLAMERKFGKDKLFKEMYLSFMQEYIDLHHMEKIEDNDCQDDEEVYYLPHHAVMKESSTTTKLRVVFDGSCKGQLGGSLNDNLMVGPTIQNDLFTTILRFRIHKYVFVADIVKMYRQIPLHHDDTNYQRILWRKNSNEPIDTYKLNTVTYGTSSAPFLAIRTLKQLGKDYETEFPGAAKIILNDLYVDDVMSGHDDLDEAIKLQEQVILILKKGGFELSKWSSNNPKLLSNVPQENCAVDSVMLLKDQESIKTLGLFWNPLFDQFSYHIDLQQPTKITKRQILSDSSRLFDPLGLLAPVIIQAKILFQRLWLIKTDWDEQLPAHLCESWLEIRQSLLDSEKLVISRWIPNSDGRIQIHGFCDASEAAYGAVAYGREVDSDGKVNINIITSKTKVAPLKQLSIPRLELCGAVLLTKLMKKIQTALSHMNIEIFLWTDSKIVICWFQEQPRKWTTFVANRCSEVITHFPASVWRHVGSKHNPADLASRGVPASLLKSSELWWSGPAFLKEPETSWPAEYIPTNVVCPETRKSQVSALTGQLTTTDDALTTPLNLLERYSDYNTLLRVTALCLRFIKNAKIKAQNPTDGLCKTVGFLTTLELTEASNIYIRYSQRENFRDEITALQLKNDLSRHSKLLKLHPFLDENNILRVGGRLNNSTLNYSTKHQIILHHKDVFTKLLVNNRHQRYLHANITLLASILFQEFWIIGQRTIVRDTVNKCLICFRFKKHASAQLMGDLPASRITPSRPFSKVGIDYGGPIVIKLHKGRTNKTEKAYIALFVCMATKAVHLEGVSSLSTADFIAALKRFASRRGNPTDIYSDNGTNFVGAKRQLEDYQRLHQTHDFNDKISQFLTTHGTNWHFNPPAAPHFGGLWEAGIKSVKSHLKRVLLNTKLTFEELCTTLTTIEACLNSRPLCIASADGTEPRPLTPGHFLIGEEFTSIPEPNLDDLMINRLDRWQFVQKLTNDFWKRWSREYLTSLQPRGKWTSEDENFKKDEIVLIMEDNMPPTQWALAVVIEAYPGLDHKTRVVKLKSKNKQFLRPIHKLCKLPIN